jgi:menaquinone-dependent protoporphyrinogen oxidase
MILVAYATKHGSTQEVAHIVAATMREEGLEVDLRRASEVDDISGYQAIVLGGSIYMGRWHPDARRFLKRHGDTMSRMLLAVFGMGPRTLEADDVAASRAQLEKSLAGVDPRRVAVFGGVVDPAKLAFPFKHMPAVDARDWKAIEAWADDVADLIKLEVLHTMRPCALMQ